MIREIARLLAEYVVSTIRLPYRIYFKNRAKNTIEEKLEKKQAAKEIAEIFPNYGEFITINEGKKSFLCKVSHKRVVHHAFYTKKTERGKEYYECYVCVRCKDIQGKLVHIVKSN